MTKNTSKKWSKKDLENFKIIILKKRDILKKELNEAKAIADDVINNNSVNAIYSSHMADASSDQQEMERNYYMMDRGNSYLQYLNRALDMIVKGSFGICSSCGNKINEERLLEVPHTTNCFDCKTKIV